MPTGGKGGGGKLTRAQQRALDELRRKAAASRKQATVTERKAQHVNDKRKRPKQKPPTGVEKALGFKTIQQSGIKPGGSKPALDLVGKTITDLAEAAIYSPGGMYAAGKAVTQDAAATKHHDYSFKHSRTLAGALAHGTAEDFKHPLRHPGYTLLDLLAAASVGAGTAAKAGAVGKAARAGELGTAAKAVVKQPVAGTRTYKLGDLEVETPNSRNALMRGGQKLHARQVNRSGNEGRQARVVAKHLTEERRVLNAGERAPAEALAERGKRLTSAQETALRAVHEETPLETTIALHEREFATAKRGSQKHADLRQKILLARAAQHYVVNANGKPVLRSEFRHLLPQRGPKRMAEVSARIEDVGGRRERTLVEAGKLEPEQIESRRAAPGRVARGAQYEPPTAAKIGKPSGSLVRQRAYVDRLEKLHGKALERAGKKAKAYPAEKVVLPATKQMAEREMTRAEATARLKELDKKYEAAIKKITPLVDPYQGESQVMDIRGRMRSVKQEEQRFRNMKSKKGGAGARYHGKQKSVSEEVRALAEKKLYALAEKHPGQQFTKDLAERERLTEALHGQMPGEEAKTYGTVTETTTAPGRVQMVPSDIPPRNLYSNPLATRLGGALSVARDRLTKMETAAAKRKKPVGLVGAESFTGGKSRIPYTTQAGVKVGRPAAYRGGEPLAPASLKKPYTGTLQKSGAYRTKSSRLVAESALEAQRYADVLSVRDRVLQASVEHLPADRENYVAVKVGTVPKPPALKMLEDKADEGITLSRTERQQLAKGFDDWKAQMFAEPTELPPGFKGYRFVRRELVEKLNKPRLLATMGQSKLLAGAGRTVMEINNAVRTSLLYLAPKYAVPNVLGNAFAITISRGVKAIPDFRHALTIINFKPELSTFYKTSMGEGFSHQLMATGGVTQKVSGPLARGWSKIVDEGFRVSALYGEMKRAGFKTHEQQLRAFESRDPRMVEAVQRAKETIGDYERLSPFERDVMRHTVFFYTWLKVSARLSKHIITEHPVQAALFAQLGKQGQALQREELGPVPSFMEPVFKVGGTHERPLVSNPSSANLFTAADVAKGIMNLVTGDHNQSGYQVAGNLSPFLALAVSEITGRDPFTQSPLKGSLAHTAFQQLTGTAPQLLLSQRLDRAHSDQSDKLYQYTPLSAWGQFLLGPLGPRTVNRQATDELARKEHLADVPPVKRAYIRVFETRGKFYDEMKRLRLLDNGKLPRPVRQAFNLEAERQGMYAAASEGKKPGTIGYHRARFEADVHLLLKYHQVDPSEGRQMLTWGAGVKDIDKLKAARRYVSDHYYQAPDGFLTMLSDSRKYLEANGAKSLG